MFTMKFYNIYLNIFFFKRKKCSYIFLNMPKGTNSFSCLYHENTKLTKACLFVWLFDQTSSLLPEIVKRSNPCHPAEVLRGKLSRSTCLTEADPQTLMRKEAAKKKTFDKGLYNLFRSTSLFKNFFVHITMKIFERVC